MVKNVNRSIGARLSGEIAKRHGNLGMNGAPITLRLKGTAGQSFGVWNAGGLHMVLEGDANDYVGKGMTGAKLVIHPPKESRFKSARPPSSVIPACPVPQAASSTRRVLPANASRCATLVPRR